MPLLVEAFDPLPEWQQAFIIVAIAVLLAEVLRKGIEIWIRGSESLQRTSLDRLILGEIDYPLYLSVLFAGVFLILPILGRPGVEFFLGGALLTAILLVWIRAGIRIGGKYVELLQEDDRGVEFAPVLKNLWSFFLVLGGFFIVLGIWEIDITPILASAGVLGIVLGYAARDSIGNFFAGISLNLDKTYQVGDMLQLEDGTRGTVTEISMRSTTILTLDRIAVTLPNSLLNQSMVINESSPSRRRRIRLDVGVAYGSDLEAVQEALLSVATDEPVILSEPTPAVRFRAFDDSAIRAQLQCYIEHPALHERARHVLISRISEAFAERDIKIPFPQREHTFFEAGNEIRVDAELREPSEHGE